MSMSSANKHSYTTTDVAQLIQQAIGAARSRRSMDRHVSVLLSRLQRDEQRMTKRLGRPIQGCNILEIGPGPYCERSRYFGRNNTATALDLDVIPIAGTWRDYIDILRVNGVGRFIKTVGRKALGVDKRRLRAWQKALNTTELPLPKRVQGDACQDPLPKSSYDVLMSWSVFEHLLSPERALQNVVQALRPGGVSYIGIHLYTSNSGHHDLRAFLHEGSLPPWPQLRPALAHTIHSNAYLNRLRLPEWRRLFAAAMPGCEEFLEAYGADELRRLMTPSLRRELADYTDEELYTIEAFFLWKKPRGSEDTVDPQIAAQ